MRDDNDKSNDDTQNDGDRVGKLPERRRGDRMIGYTAPEPALALMEIRSQQGE